MRRVRAGIAWVLTGALAATSSVVAQPAPEQTHVFVAGQDGYHTFRIPALVRAPSGRLLAFCEGRVHGAGDAGDIDLVLRTSEDHGRTWGTLTVVQEDGEHTIGNPAPVFDRDTGRLWLLFCRNNDRVFVTSSDDEGATWGTPREITRAVKKPTWRWYATGPCHGIQLARGIHAGRLVIPCDHGSERYGGGSHIVYSDDHGATWTLGGVIEAQNGLRPNECVATELSDGRLMLNCRNGSRRPKRRLVTHSDDGGETFGPLVVDEQLIDPVVQASAVRVSHAERGDWIVFSNPAMTASRRRMTVRNSFDEGDSWTGERVIWPGPAAYSDLEVTADGAVALLFENGDRGPYERITCVRLDAGWLADATTSAIVAYDDMTEEHGGHGFRGGWSRGGSDELVGLWRFDRGFADASGHDRTGRAVDATLSDEAPAPLGRGRAAVLGGGRHVDLSAHVAALQPLTTGTIAAWFRTDTGGTQAIFAASDTRDASREIRLFLEEEELRFDVRGDAPSDAQLASDPLLLGVWHHAAATVDVTGEARLFVDGIEVARDVQPFFAAVHDLDHVAIGRNVDSSGPQWPFEGAIDDVAVFARALSPREVAALAAGEDPRRIVGDPNHTADTCRVLAAPLPMDRDADLYVSCLVERTGDGDFALVLRGEAAQPIAQFGWTDGHVAAGGPRLVAGDRAMPPGRAMRLVARIRAKPGAAGDQVMVAAFPADAPLPTTDASLAYAGEDAWTVVSPTFVCNRPMVSLHLDARAADTAYEIEDLRIGETWSAVTARPTRPNR